MEWPKDRSPMDFEDLVSPIVSALLETHDIRRNGESDVDWFGPDLGAPEKAICLSPVERLTKANLDSEFESQGRGALEIIVSIAIQLGIEQGRRIAETDHKWLEKIEALAKKEAPDAGSEAS